MANITVSLQSFAQGDEAWSSAGEPIRLGKIIHPGGGEGAIYEVVGKPDHAAKIYHKPVSQDKIAKLGSMPAMLVSHPQLKKMCAWPQATLHTISSGVVGGTMGFLMDRIRVGKDIHYLTSPTTRKKEYPNRDWSFLLHVSRNLAGAIDTIHATNTVIGDINERGFIVVTDGTIRVVDCDSFQVASGGRTFPCEVGIADYTPPELQQLTEGFQSVVRTKNHDNFGLAVIIFKLLMMGRHPYAGIYEGPERDRDLSSLIRDNRFAYGEQSAERLNRPPPHALRLDHLTARLGNLFNAAFSDAGRTSGRPEASAWIAALDDMLQNLATCQIQQAHKHVRGASCPWCPLEAASGVIFFICVHVDQGGDTWHLNIESIRHDVDRLPPIPTDDLPVFRVPTCIGAPITDILAKVKEADDRARAKAAADRAAAEKARVISFWGVINLARYFARKTSVVRSNDDSGSNDLVNEAMKKALAAEIQARAERKKQQLRSCNDLATAWRAANPTQAPTELRLTLTRSVQEYAALEQVRQQGLEQLEREKIEAQIIDYLEGIPIRGQTIYKISTAKIAMLESFGISTAADIDKVRIMKIHGFGGRGILAEALVTWRNDVSRNYNPDVHRPIEPRVRAAFDKNIMHRRQRLESSIEQEARRYTAMVQRIHVRREELIPTMKTAKAAYHQAVADEKLAKEQAELL